MHRVTISGKLLSIGEVSHPPSGEDVYKVTVAVPRLSGKEDILPVLVSKNKYNVLPTLYKDVTVVGSLQTYNKRVGDKRKLILCIFADSIEIAKPYELGTNDIAIIGTICKAPLMKTTTGGITIAEMIVAINDVDMSYYIPVVAWKGGAHYAEKYCEVGEKIRVLGRLESRQYTKKFDDGSSEECTAYELSAGRLYMGDRVNENFI